MEFVGTAMEDDISNGDASRVLTEVAKDALSILRFVVNVHHNLKHYYPFSLVLKLSIMSVSV